MYGFPTYSIRSPYLKFSALLIDISEDKAARASSLSAHPEAVDRITRSVPLGRWGQPAEVAEAVAFLASRDAGFITGEILTIDGGARLGRGTFDFA